MKIPLITSLLAIAVFSFVEAQNANQFSPETRAGANQILQSPLAKYLSGTGMTALMRIGGQLPAAPRENANNAVIGVDPSSLAGRGQIVNDPAQDILAAFDISTQSETNIAAYGPHVVAAYNDSTGFATTGSGMAWSVSHDNGDSWTEVGPFPVSKTAFNEGDPGVVAGSFGNFYASAILFDTTFPPNYSSTVGIAKSNDQGNSFSLPVYVPAFPVPPNSFAFTDKPLITADATASPFKGNIYVTFTLFILSATEETPIMVSRSDNGAKSFGMPRAISVPNTLSQGSAPAVGPNGELYVAWLQIFDPAHPNNPSMIMVAKSVDGGKTFGSPVPVAPLASIGFGAGTLDGNFRVNSFPRMDVNPVNGHVYIVYAANPGVAAANRDGSNVYFVRSTDGGSTWSPPLKVNDDNTANDQFFPVIAVSGTGEIQMIWNDRRGDPLNLKYAVFSAKSTDDGTTFSPNTSVTGVDFLPAVGYDPELNPVYMGDYIDIRAGQTGTGRNNAFYLLWTDTRRVVITNGGRRHDQDVFFAIY